MKTATPWQIQVWRRRMREHALLARAQTKAGNLDTAAKHLRDALLMRTRGELAAEYLRLCRRLCR